jgi:hypothetical protein
MGKVKELLHDYPFTEAESMYSLARRMLVQVEIDLSYPELSTEYEQDLVRLRTSLKEIIEYEDLSSRVQQS